MKAQLTATILVIGLIARPGVAAAQNAQAVSFQGESNQPTEGPKDLFSKNVLAVTMGLGAGFPIGAFGSNDAYQDFTGGAGIGRSGAILFSYHWTGKLRQNRKTWLGRPLPPHRNYHGIGLYISSEYFPQSKEWVNSLLSKSNPAYEYRMTFTGFSMSSLGLGYSFFQLFTTRFFSDQFVGAGYSLIRSGDYSMKVFQNGRPLQEYKLAYDQTSSSIEFRLALGLNYRIKKGFAVRLGGEWLNSAFTYAGSFGSYYYNQKEIDLLYNRDVSISSLILTLGIKAMIDSGKRDK